MTAVFRDQFAILGKRVRHLPTGARFIVGSSVISWGQAGDVLSNGQLFAREDVHRVATEIMQEIAELYARIPGPAAGGDTTDK